MRRVLFWNLVADPPSLPCAGEQEIVVLLRTRLVLCFCSGTHRVRFVLFLFAEFQVGPVFSWLASSHRLITTLGGARRADAAVRSESVLASSHCLITTLSGARWTVAGIWDESSLASRRRLITTLGGARRADARVRAWQRVRTHLALVAGLG